MRGVAGAGREDTGREHQTKSSQAHGGRLVSERLLLRQQLTICRRTSQLHPRYRYRSGTPDAPRFAWRPRPGRAGMIVARCTRHLIDLPLCSPRNRHADRHHDPGGEAHRPAVHSAVHAARDPDLIGRRRRRPDDPATGHRLQPRSVPQLRQGAGHLLPRRGVPRALSELDQRVRDYRCCVPVLLPAGRGTAVRDPRLPLVAPDRAVRS